MSISITITLTSSERDALLFDVYTNSDGYKNPIVRGLTQDQLLNGYRINIVPSGADTIRVRAQCECINYIDIPIPPIVEPSPSLTPSLTRTPSVTPTITVTISVTPSLTPTITTTATPTITITPSATPTETVTPTVTPTVSATISITPTVTLTISQTPTISTTPSRTPSVTVTISVSPTITVTASLTPTISVTPTVTSTISVTPSRTPSISVTLTPGLSVSATPTITVTPSVTVTKTITPSITPSTTPNVDPVQRFYSSSYYKNTAGSSGVSFALNSATTASIGSVLVFSIDMVNSTNFTSTVTYAGTNLVKIMEVMDSGTGGGSQEPMNMSVWFAPTASGGYPLSAGNQTVNIQLSSGGPDHWFAAIALVNDRGYTHRILASGSVGEDQILPQVPLNFSGSTAVVIQAIGSGYRNLSDMTVPAGVYLLQGQDQMNNMSARVDYKAGSTVNYLAGYSGSGNPDDTAMVAIALVSQIQPSVTPTKTISVTPSVSLTLTPTKSVTPSITVTKSITPSITNTPSISRTPTVTATPSSTPFSSPAIVQDSSMILYLDARNPSSYPGSGTTFSDLSGNGNNFTINSATYNSAGWYFTLNGTSNYMYRAALNVAGLTNSATCTAWVRPAAQVSDTTYNGIFSYGPRTCDGTSFLMSVNNTLGPTFAKWCDDFSSPTSNMSTSAWWNYTVVLNGSSVTFYLNAVSAGSGTVGTNNIGVDVAAIGSTDFGIGNATGRYFKGDISSIYFYNRALSLSEVQQNFNAVKSRYGL